MNDGSGLRDDFLLDLEDAVGIRLTKREWRACKTVGDAERVVGERVSLGGPARPLLPVARERTRAALAAALDRDVALDTGLERAFPRAGRLDRWERFHDYVGTFGLPERFRFQS